MSTSSGTRLRARAILIALAGTLLVGATFVATPAVAATQTLTVKHTDVTTTEGALNETYYGGGTWASVSTAHYADAGAFFDVAFQGSAVDLYGSLRNTNGTGTVYIDGNAAGTANYYAASSQTSVKVFSATGLSAGTHVIKVVANGWINHVSTVVTQDVPEAVGTQLSALITQLSTRMSGDYTAGSWSAFTTELDIARSLLTDSSATQDQIDAETTHLQSVADQLVEIKGLASSITDYQTRVPTSYTTESWTPFAAALTAAGDTVKRADATAASVTAAKTALQNAAAALVSVGSGSLAEIHNDSWWKDTAGNPIYSQGGGVFRFGDTYYWYGVDYRGAATYESNPTALNSDTTFVGVPVYSSQDLVNWTFRNMIATPQTKLSIPTSKNVTGTYFSDMKTLGDATWIGRLGVVYNENTGKYVMISQMENKDPTRATNASDVFLEGDSPVDDFQYANIQTQIKNAPQQGTGDQSVFTDDDGTDYLLFSNRNGRGQMFLSKIDPADSLSIDPGVQISRNPAGREGNAMFKIGDTYYAAGSDLHGYNTSVSYIVQSMTADPQGAYSPEYVLPGTEKDYSHVTQTGFFFTVHGTKKDTVVFAGDRWADFAWNGIGYNQWMPLSGTGSNVSFNSVSDWNLNATTGEWSVGNANNYILNPEFAADRVAVSNVTGWTNVVDPSSVATSMVSNPAAGANGTHYALRLGASTAFSGSTYQDITLPDGLYQFSLQNQSTGGLSSAKAVVTGSSGQSYSLDLSAATNGYTNRSMGELKITGGSARVTFSAVGPGGTSVTVDNLSLTKEAVNRGDLQSLVGTAQARTSAGISAASWSTFQKALTAAQDVLNDPTVTQDDIDSARSALTDAQNGLTPAVVSITLAGVATSYGVGDPFDRSGLTVTAVRADGSTAQLASSDVEVTGYSSTQAGRITVTVSVDAGLSAVGSDAVSAAIPVTIYAQWSKATAYSAGAQVWYGGAEWVASWYTKGQQPGDPNGAWQEYRTDAAGVAIWTPSRTFNAGDAVDYAGTTYRADWWTRGEQPGSATGPWEEIRTDASGIAIWTPSRVFNAGDVADYGGVLYTAKWWTRNQQPGTADAWTPKM